MQVELLALLIPGPGRPGEGRSPVGGLGARLPGGEPVNLPGGPPDVPVALGVVLGGAAGGEPGVLVAGVVDDEVHDQAHAATVQSLDEGVEVGQGSEEGVDVLVVGDVVAVVVLRGAVDGAEPHDVDTQLVEVVQSAGQAGDVTDPVAVGVGEGAGVDLVDDGAAPPVRVIADVVGRDNEGCGRGHGRLPSYRTGDARKAGRAGCMRGYPCSAASADGVLRAGTDCVRTRPGGGPIKISSRASLGAPPLPPPPRRLLL